MPRIIGIVNLTMAALALLWGVSTEYRQSRQDGPVAIVATLPFGVAAALLATVGTASLLGRRLPIWLYVVPFAVLAAMFGFAISSSSASSDSGS